MKDKQLLIKVSEQEKKRINELTKFNNFESVAAYIRWVINTQYKKMGDK